MTNVSERTPITFKVDNFEGAFLVLIMLFKLNGNNTLTQLLKSCKSRLES